MNTTDTMAMRPLLFSEDLQFWYETLRWLGLAAYGGADFGEVVTTAARIRQLIWAPGCLSVQVAKNY